MTFRRPGRSDDEQLLCWLAARHAGARAAEIGRQAGTTGQRVATATNRVLQADLGESGEPEAVVLAGYWT